MRTKGFCEAAGKWAVLVAVLALGSAARAQETFALASTAPAAATNEISGGLPNTSAVDTQVLSTVRVPKIQPAGPIRMTGIEKLPSRRSWLILSLAQHSAAGFDAYSTRLAIGDGAVERDPLMRPFANSPAIYGAIQVGPVLLDYAARRMQGSRSNFVRHLWWLPQSTSTAMFLFSGVHNLHVAGELAR